MMHSQIAQRKRKKRSQLFVGLMCCFFCLSSNLLGQTDNFELEPINYSTAEVNDAISELSEQIKSGEVKLEFDEEHGYLKSLLEILEIPVSSQTLVFSKTSLQVQRISPRRPRAIYFNDDIYVGWCQKGDIIEIAATDPKQGPTFYSLKQTPEDVPTIVRDQGQCIVCHATHRTQNVPGYLVRSVYANRAGRPNFGSGTFTTTQSSPFKKRWGGWYVTGTHGDMRHMGNTFFRENERSREQDSGANVTTLEEFFPTKPYLSGHSDLVALMVLEHQTQMHNAITFANFETRRALHQSKTMNKILGRAPDFVSDSAKRRISSAAENVVKHLLMCDEFPLENQVAGTSDFAKEFSARGKRDSKNRSLRDLNLAQRTFQFPCSYLIYSPSFKELPREVHELIMSRLVEVLTGKDQSDEFQHLSADSRIAILEILRETLPDFERWENRK